MTHAFLKKTSYFTDKIKNSTSMEEKKIYEECLNMLLIIWSAHVKAKDESLFEIATQMDEIISNKIS